MKTIKRIFFLYKFTWHQLQKVIIKSFVNVQRLNFAWKTDIILYVSLYIRRVSHSLFAVSHYLFAVSHSAFTVPNFFSPSLSIRRLYFYSSSFTLIFTVYHSLFAVSFPLLVVSHPLLAIFYSVFAVSHTFSSYFISFYLPRLTFNLPRLTSYLHRLLLLTCMLYLTLSSLSLYVLPIICCRSHIKVIEDVMSDS